MPIFRRIINTGAGTRRPFIYMKQSLWVIRQQWGMIGGSIRASLHYEDCECWKRNTLVDLSSSFSVTSWLHSLDCELSILLFHSTILSFTNLVNLSWIKLFTVLKMRITNKYWRLISISLKDIFRLVFWDVSIYVAVFPCEL